MTEKLLIIGSGPAGYTAAIYAARAKLAPTLFTGDKPGGQLMMTTEVDNFPGFPEGIQGPQLMMNMQKQAEKYGAKLVSSTVTKVDFAKSPLEVTAGNTTYQANAVIVATGASSKWLGLPRENELIGHGVSSCATCDAAFFRDKEVVVVGGGDSALEDATFLTRFAKSVRVIVRKDKLKASKPMQERAEKDSKLTIVYNTEVRELHGAAKLEGITVENTATKQTEKWDVSGLFVAIGHTPNSSVFSSFLKVEDKFGYIVPKAGSHVHTEIPGVFVCGDVHDFHYRQAITAAGFGCMAALEAQRYLEHAGIAA